MSEATDEVLDLEKRFWTEADDRHFFETHLADNAITVIEPMGFITKQQAVQMPAEKPWIDVEMTDVHIEEQTPDCVTLAYHGQGHHEGDEKPYQGSVASVYLRRDGQWQLALSAHQPWKPEEKPAG